MAFYDTRRNQPAKKEEVPMPPLGPVGVMFLCGLIFAGNAAYLKETGKYLFPLFTISIVGFLIAGIGLFDKRFFYASYPATAQAMKIPPRIRAINTAVIFILAIPIGYVEYFVLGR